MSATGKTSQKAYKYINLNIFIFFYSHIIYFHVSNQENFQTLNRFINTIYRCTFKMLNGNFRLSFGLFLNEIFIPLIYLYLYLYVDIPLIYLSTVCIFFLNWSLYISDVFIVIVYCSIYHSDFISSASNKKRTFGLKNINWGFPFDKKKM